MNDLDRYMDLAAEVAQPDFLPKYAAMKAQLLAVKAYADGLEVRADQAFISWPSRIYRQIANEIRELL